MNASFFVARRLFLRRSREAFRGRPLVGAALGIFLALVPLVTVDHLADGMIRGIVSRYQETWSYHAQIHSLFYPSRGEWEELVEGLEDHPGILSVWMERQGFGLARASASREGLTLRALPKDIPKRDPRFLSYLEFDAGSWDLESPDSVLLGRESARKLGVGLGDTLRVLTVRPLPENRYAPRVSRFTVTGIFSTGYQELDRTWAIIPLEKGWSILSEENSLTFLGLKTPDPERRIERLLIPEHYRLYDWRMLNRARLKNLSSTRTMLLFIMALLIVVAVMNVSSSLIMLTLERRQIIGILKCIGASPRTLIRGFVSAGLLAALVGTILGLSTGLLVSWYINEIIRGMEFLLGWVLSLFSPSTPPPRLLAEGYYLQHIPIKIRWVSLALIGFSTLLLSWAAGLVPVRRAVRLRPLEVLRKH